MQGLSSYTAGQYHREGPEGGPVIVHCRSVTQGGTGGWARHRTLQVSNTGFDREGGPVIVHCRSVTQGGTGGRARHRTLQVSNTGWDWRVGPSSYTAGQ